ncbi:MAG: hypothetical protein U9Q88_00105 [Bacillota bacterium]|nr:hypothetical protein [Bacillota bacterium]
MKSNRAISTIFAQTNLYDFYVIGFILLVVGAGCMVIVRKRRRVL